MADEVKIALVGSAPSSSRNAPYGDPSWRIYGCSPGLYGVAQRIDEWFELHLWEPGQPWFSPEYVQWLNNLPKRGATLWTGRHDPDGPDQPSPVEGGKVLPYREILAEFDPQGWFCTSSLFWMMAMAIKAGATKIGFWGVDMAASEEYEAQRAGIHFMTYVAQYRGIEVGVPHESDLFTPRFRYGIDEWTHSFRKTRARDAELAARCADAQHRLTAAQNEVAFLSGARDDLNYMRQTWANRSTFTGPVTIKPQEPATS